MYDFRFSLCSAICHVFPAAFTAPNMHVNDVNNHRLKLSFTLECLLSAVLDIDKLATFPLVISSGTI